MVTWLLVFGVGGCWSGYTDATIIQAADREEALRTGGDIAWKETAEERGHSHGCSFDVERLEGDVRKARLYLSRCKPEAQVLAEQAFDRMMEVAHG